MTEQTVVSAEAEQLQEHLARLRTGWPLVKLTRGQADAQALRLRKRGMSYAGIAVTMAAYHGDYLTPAGWQWRCRRNGAPRSKGPLAVKRGA